MTSLSRPALSNTMAPTSWLALLVALVSVSTRTHAIPASSALLPRQGGITPLTPAQIAEFKPYTWYAATTACNISDIIRWTCGEKCNANPTFKPVAVGGDGNQTQFCKSLVTCGFRPAHRSLCDPGFSGYDPTLDEIIVGHQGTDASQL